MSDTCECEEFDVIFEDLTSEELGPAYPAYKNGLKIEKKWLPDKKLTPTFMGDCCPKRPYNFYDDVLWPEHLTMLVIWHVLAVIFIFLWYRRQSYQPLRFRGFREMLLMWFTMSFMFTYQVLSSCGGFTTNCVSMLFAFEVFLPAHMMFYIVKGIQFSYIYTWNAAKSTASNVETIKWFYNHKWILSFRTLVTSMAIAGLIGFISTISRLADPFYSQDGINFYSTFRCKWWQIPSEYTTALRPNDNRCSCLAASQIDSELDPQAYLNELYPCMVPLYGSSVTSAYPLFAAPNTSSSCSLVEQKIANGTALTELDLSFQEWCGSCQIDLSEDGCNACFASASLNPYCQECLANITATAEGDEAYVDTTTSSLECLFCGASLNNANCQSCLGQIAQPPCSNYLRHFYLHGDEQVGLQSCGFFDETPHSSTCKFCLTSDRQHLVGWAFYIFFFAFVMLTIGVLCARMQDQLGLNREIIINAVNIIIVVSVVISGMLSEKVHEGYVDTWNTYSLIYFFVYFMLWVNMLTSIIFPVLMCYYYLYRDMRIAAVNVLLKHDYEDEKKSIIANPDTASPANNATDGEMTDDARTIAAGGVRGVLFGIYLVLTTSGHYDAEAIVTNRMTDVNGMRTVWTPDNANYSRLSGGQSENVTNDGDTTPKVKAELRYKRRSTNNSKASPLNVLQMEKLEFCFVNAQCLELYEKFSREEFTVENVKFLCASYAIELAIEQFEMLDIGAISARDQKIAQIRVLLSDLYSNFIRTDSPMEINIPSKTRIDLEKKLLKSKQATSTATPTMIENPVVNEEKQEQRIPVSSRFSVRPAIVTRVIRQSVTAFMMKSPAPTKSDEASVAATNTVVDIIDDPRIIVTWLIPAVSEVKQLILRDSWSRFELTSLHKEFDTLYKSNSALDEKIGDLYVAEHNRKNLELVRKPAADTKKKKGSDASSPSVGSLGASSSLNSSVNTSAATAHMRVLDDDEDIH